MLLHKFSPLKELAGRPVDLDVLRQFGLLESERTDSLLNSAISSKLGTAEPPNPELGKGPGRRCRTPIVESESRRDRVFAGTSSASPQGPPFWGWPRAFPLSDENGNA